MKANLLKDMIFSVINANTQKSWFWRKIIKLRQLFRPMIMHEAGNGQQIFICHYHWHPKGPLLPVYGPSSALVLRLHLEAKLSSVITEYQWHPVRTDTLLEIQTLLYDSIAPKD